MILKKKIRENTLEKRIKIETTIIVSTTIVDSILDYVEDKICRFNYNSRLIWY